MKYSCAYCSFEVNDEELGKTYKVSDPDFVMQIHMESKHCNLVKSLNKTADETVYFLKEEFLFETKGEQNG